MTTAHIVTPAAAGQQTGNRVTALRWLWMLRRCGVRTTVSSDYDGAPVDLLVGLHAVKSFASVQRYVQRWPGRPLVVALAGTDLYRTAEPGQRAKAEQALSWADRIVVLQREALTALPDAWRPKVRVIHQSCTAPASPATRESGGFEVCVAAHLRAVKDPLLAARAAALVPEDSTIRIVHVGAQIEPGWGAQAKAQMATNPRYRWLGPAPRLQTLRRIAAADLLVVTSHAEGGANVVSEALVCDTPVVSTRIAGSVGLLGSDYPGYVDVGDAAGLASMLRALELDRDAYRSLQTRCRGLAERFAPVREQQAWAALLAELFTAPSAWPPALS